MVEVLLSNPLPFEDWKPIRTPPVRKPKNTGKQLPASKIAEIRSLYDGGKTNRQIAEMLGIHLNTVRKYTKGNT